VTKDDEGRAFILARLSAAFGGTHNIRDEGSGLTQFVSFVLTPVAEGYKYHVLEIHEDLLDDEELERQVNEAQVDRVLTEGVRKLRVWPSRPAEVLEQYS
jgi:hypothetical protein